MRKLKQEYTKYVNKHQHHTNPNLGFKTLKTMRGHTQIHIHTHQQHHKKEIIIERKKGEKEEGKRGEVHGSQGKACQ